MLLLQVCRVSLSFRTTSAFSSTSPNSPTSPSPVSATGSTTPTTLGTTTPNVDSRLRYLHVYCCLLLLYVLGFWTSTEARASTGEKQSICDYDNGDDDDDDGDYEDDSYDYDYGDDDGGNYDKDNGDEDGDRNRSAAVAELSASSAAKPRAKSSSMRGTMQSRNKQTTLQAGYITNSYSHSVSHIWPKRGESARKQRIAPYKSSFQSINQ